MNFRGLTYEFRLYTFRECKAEATNDRDKMYEVSKLPLLAELQNRMQN